MRCEFHRPSKDLDDYVDFLICMQWSDYTAHIRNFPPAQLSLFFNFGDDIFVHPAKVSGRPKAPLQKQLYPRMMLEGLRSTPSDYITPGQTGLVIAALKPLARAALQHIGGAFALRDNINLHDVYGSQLPDVPAQLAAAKTVKTRFLIVESFLRRFLQPTTVEARTQQAFSLVAANPYVPVEELSRKMGLSKRQFDRIFQAGIGTSPKHYARVLRLQYSLRLINNPRLSLTQIAHEAGFHDQSHFIRDFKGLTGFTPSAYRAQQQVLSSSEPVHRDFSPREPSEQSPNPVTIVCDSNLIVPAA